MDKVTSKILLIAVIICVLGILSIYSSTYQKEDQIWKMLYKRQMVWVIAGIVLFMVMANFSYRRLWEATYFLYGAALLLLMLVFILGIVRLGAQRWIKLSWFNLQPSELVKLVMAIFFARYFSDKLKGNISVKVQNMGIWRSLIIPFLFLMIPLAMIIEQPDLGSGLMVFFLFIIVLYLANVKLRYLLLVLLVCSVCFPVFWHFLRDYQKDRLLVFLNPNLDPLGAGYTVIQSKIAIGSGGLFGKGWFSGTQSQLHFLPESHTDFIFATFTEEWGFLGASVIIILYYMLIKMGIGIGERTYDSFGRLLAFGISSMLGIQIIINIAMNLGFAPIVGVPLPLMSYGGSSVLITFLSLGILANIGKSRA